MVGLLAFLLDLCLYLSSNIQREIEWKNFFSYPSFVHSKYNLCATFNSFCCWRCGNGVLTFSEFSFSTQQDILSEKEKGKASEGLGWKQSSLQCGILGCNCYRVGLVKSHLIQWFIYILPPLCGVFWLECGLLVWSVLYCLMGSLPSSNNLTLRFCIFVWFINQCYYIFLYFLFYRITYLPIFIFFFFLSSTGYTKTL